MPGRPLFVGMTLSTDVDVEELLQEARGVNLARMDGQGFIIGGSGDRSIHLPFCAQNLEEIEAGIVRLAQAVCGLN